MSNKERQRNKRVEFDLDDYLEEQAEGKLEQENTEETSPNKQRKVGFWIIIAALVALYFMNPLSTFDGFFADAESESLEQVVTPLPPVAEAPLSPTVNEVNLQTNNVNVGLVEYLAALQNFDISEDISVNGANSLFNENVPLSYIEALEESDLFDELSAAGILNIYRQGIPLSYINTLGNADIFDEMSAAGIVGLYNQGVPANYVLELGNSDIFDEMSGAGMLALYILLEPVDYIMPTFRQFRHFR